MMTAEAIKYNNDPRKRGSTIVLAMPGAGGKMLLELMALAGGTKVTGNQEPGFYHAITTMIESLSSNANDYGKVNDVAKSDNGLKFYARDSKEHDINLSSYCIKNLLLKTLAGSGFALTERMTSNEESWIERFCSAIRFINDNSTVCIKLAFLVSDLSHMQYANPIEHNKLLQHYKDAMELGDIWLKKSDLIANPIKAMTRLQCNMYPDEEKVKSIIKKYEEGTL